MNENPIETGQTEVQAPGVDPAKKYDTIAAYGFMLKEIRSWSYWLLGLGALHLISSGFLNASWGILLIVVGLASFYFRTASMFVIYAVTLAWAALSNISSFNAGWAIFAVFQLFLVVRVFQQFLRFRQTEAEFLMIPTSNSQSSALLVERTSRWFPWAGPLFGCFSIVSVVASIAVVVVLLAINGESMKEPPFFFNLMVGFIELFAVLGLGISLASLLSNYRPKALSIIGLIISSVMMIFWLLSNLGLI